MLKILLLLERIVTACRRSPIVDTYTVLTLRADVLKLRVHLVDGSFIEVFHNIATGKSAFALIAAESRIYGKDKDNAKMGWHVHPAENPETHKPCDPVSFEESLAEVEALRFRSPQDG
ncbi:hypothetical protein HRbin08_01855 [bacterium HR08]|nr:hypothetical protein HRbin08_01855 [bacterium HR08]